MFKKKVEEAPEVIVTEKVKSLVGDITDDLRAELIGGTVKGVEAKIKEILNAEDSIVELRKRKFDLEQEIVKLKSKAKLEETEIKALVKLNEERNALKLEQKELELERSFQSKEVDMLKQYHADLETAIEKQTIRFDEVIDKVLNRLTNIQNAEVKGNPVQVIK